MSIFVAHSGARSKKILDAGYLILDEKMNPLFRNLETQKTSDLPLIVFRYSVGLLVSFFVLRSCFSFRSRPTATLRSNYYKWSMKKNKIMSSQISFVFYLSSIQHRASSIDPLQAMRYYLHQLFGLPVSRFGGIRAGKAELHY